jgi:MoaE-MoaD fusion protein
MESSATIDVRLRLFARQRQIAGVRELRVSLATGSSIVDAWAALVERYPDFKPDGAYVRFARNGAYADAGERLADGDEVACIPPVAGGATAGSRILELTAEPITDDVIATARTAVASTADGAIVTFIGTTRETPGTPAPGGEDAAARHVGQQVVRLEYEAYEELALAVLGQIAGEIEARFGVERVAIIHRTGRVSVGEPSVAIVVAAPHREPAFAACRYAIEELKARAPIWKEEHFADGSVWLGAPARTRAEDPHAS